MLDGLEPDMKAQSQPNSPYRGELKPLGNLTVLETKWRALEPESDASFFLSWSWIGPWLRLVQLRAELKLYECHDQHGNLIAVAVIGCNEVKRRHLVRAKTLSINEVCDSALNMCIEYNGLLARRGHEAAAIQQFIVDLSTIAYPWDELLLTNIPEQLQQSLQPDAADIRYIQRDSQGVWSAPLAGITDIESVVGRLSKSRRWQIRRSFKEYEKKGALTIEAAASAEQALQFFDAMGIYHTDRWRSLGENGSYARAEWVNFHRDLIKSAFDRGEIQLLRIQCGGRDIGYIYNFLWRGSVLGLQSGFVYEDNNALRPGYVSHILAMQFNASLGASEYNFLMGDAQHKRVLGEPLPPLITLRLQRPRLRFHLENGLMRGYSFLRKISHREQS